MYFEIRSIIKKGNRISYNYSTDATFFNKDIEPYYEFPFNVENIPDSVAMIPYFGVLLTIAFAMDIEIILPTLDKNIFNNIELIRNGFQSYLKDNELKGKVVVKELVENIYEPNKNNNLLLASCGVDFFYTFLKEKDNVNKLIYVQGGDIGIDKEEENIWSANNVGDVAKKEEKDLIVVRSNFRKTFDINYINEKCPFLTTGFSDRLLHGPAYLCIANLIGYVYKSEKLYISSASVEGHDFLCASNPHSDPYFALANLNVIHYGFNTSRYDKVKYISDFEITYDHLHICIGHKGNCGQCAKCYMTECMLYSIGKLDNYKNVFDLDKFNNEKVRAYSYGKILSVLYPDLKFYYKDYINDLKYRDKKTYNKVKRHVFWILLTHSYPVRLTKFLYSRIRSKFAK